MGLVEQYETVYAVLEQYGVPATVWDEVLEEMFGPPRLKVPGPFQLVCWSSKLGYKEAADFPRDDDMSDETYIRSILEKASEYWQTLDHIDRDFWQFNPETCSSKKILAS